MTDLDALVAEKIAAAGPVPKDHEVVPEKSSIIVKPLEQDVGLRRIAEARDRLNVLRQTLPTMPQEDAEARRIREVREADVVEAARRSQAEIRRHVDSYLKEHFETLVADVANAVTTRVHEHVTRGIAAMQETQQIQIDRIAADMRAQLRAFTRAAYGKPKAAKVTAKKRGKR